MNRSFPFVYKLLLRISLLVCIFNLVPGAPHIHCSQYLDSHATTAYTTLWEPTVVPANLTLAEDRCQKTVAFAFLAQSGLPLRSIWQEYFDTCLPGHYLTLVHTGDPDAWHGERFMNRHHYSAPRIDSSWCIVTLWIWNGWCHAESYVHCTRAHTSTVVLSACLGAHTIRLVYTTHRLFILPAYACCTCGKKFRTNG